MYAIRSYYDVQSLYNSSLRDEYRMQADRLERLKRAQARIARGTLDPASLAPQEREQLAELRSRNNFV